MNRPGESCDATCKLLLLNNSTLFLSAAKQTILMNDQLGNYEQGTTIDQSLLRL